MCARRQFRREEARARAAGLYSPPGLANPHQFRHAFKKFSIRVSEEQAHALFIKYGHDAQVRVSVCVCGGEGRHWGTGASGGPARATMTVGQP